MTTSPTTGNQAGSFLSGGLPGPGSPAIKGNDVIMATSATPISTRPHTRARRCHAGTLRCTCRYTSLSVCHGGRPANGNAPDGESAVGVEAEVDRQPNARERNQYPKGACRRMPDDDWSDARADQ
jgi:hypothetical protein